MNIMDAENRPTLVAYVDEYGFITHGRVVGAKTRASMSAREHVELGQEDMNTHAIVVSLDETERKGDTFVFSLDKAGIATRVHYEKGYVS
jgi:hypothetical protein